MRAAACLVTLGIVLSSLQARSADQAPQPPPRSPGVLRVGVDLVQVDATVTDSRGRHVPDLTAADFEILQDGRPQQISTFSYIRLDGQPAAETRAVGPVAPARPLARDQVRRTIALVVDDLGLSFESTVRVREMLKRFIDTQVETGDLVAILRTGGGMGTLQQFTSDRRMLHAAADRVRWTMITRATAFESESDANARLHTLRSEYFAAGTLGAISYIVRGIGELPGRKSVVVLSDGFQIVNADRSFTRAFDALRTLVDAANRAGVVVYTIDARGLVTIAPTAADTGDPIGLMNDRREELFRSSEGLAFLARETGGFMVANNNDLGGAVRRALDDGRAYYLLGYVPDRSTFGARMPRFHRLNVRVKRPGLRVRSRRGFLGVSDDEQRPAAPANPLVAAVTSPFAGGDIRLRLTSFFGQVDKGGPAVNSVMHIESRDLTHAEQPDGVRISEIDVLAVTFDGESRVADQSSRRFTVRLTPAQYEEAQVRGFVYRTRVQLKRPGPYQLRIALRDATSGRIGSASQFIDVPDVKKGRLTLSGLVIEGASGAAGVDGAEGVDTRHPHATVALRTFKQGTEANYGCYVYNARRGRDGLPQLESEVRLYRQGAEVFRNTSRDHITTTPSGALLAGGVLQLGRALTPGSYVLELTVTDRLAKKSARATQTIDFDVVP